MNIFASMNVLPKVGRVRHFLGSRLLLLACLGSLLSACTTTYTPHSSSALPSSSVPPSKPGGYYQDDGPGHSPRPDLASIPDAVPYDITPIKGGPNRPYTVLGRSYTPLTSAKGFRQSGLATWYGTKYHGRKTSSGELYDMYGMTAAHTTLPIPSFVRVTNTQNKRSIIVKINDRGPFIGDRIIDLSYTAASKLDIIQKGSGWVEIETVTESTQAISNKDLPSPNSHNTPNPHTIAPSIPALPSLQAQLQRHNGRHYIEIAPLVDRVSAEKLKAQMYLEWSTLETVEIIAQSSFFSLRVGVWNHKEDAQQVLQQIRPSLKTFATSSDK